MEKTNQIDEETARNIFDRVHNPKTDMKGDRLLEMKRKIAESMSVDRQKLVVRMPFTGGMLMHFELVPVRSFRLDTASTDGSRIFFDMDFYTKLTPEERLFVLAHECWHSVNLTFLRRQGRNFNLWNIATDCEINNILSGNGFKAPENLCFPDPGDEGKSAEELYEKLLKKCKNSAKNGQQEKDGSGKMTGSSSNDSKSGGGRDGNGGSGKRNGKVNKDDRGLSGQFDKHEDKDIQEDENGEICLPEDKWGEKGEDTDYRPRIDSEIAEKIRESVISEAQKYERQRGTLPGCLESVLERYRKPEISWKEVLCQEVTKCYSDRREWLPPNRRFVHKGLYIPSRKGEKVRCTVAIDTSGSCTADIPKFMGELVGILNSFSNYEMKVIQCDAEIQSVEDYDDYNQFPIEDVSRMKFKGFGGTSFVPVFDYLRDECEDDTNILIYFTDSYGDAPKDPPPYPVLWVLTSEAIRNSDFCQWGRKLFFKEKRTEYNNDN